MLKGRVRSYLSTFAHRTQWGSGTLAQYLHRLRRPAWLGISHRATPLSVWGLERGSSVDRYYIERFLAEHRYDIRGRVLEVGDTSYIDMFGVGVKQSEVLDIDSTNPRATIITDLAAADVIPSDYFDCFICTQTLQYIYDIHAALAHAHRILRPNGVLLATVPCLCRVNPTGDYWRLTSSSCEKLFGEVFGVDQITVSPQGNVLSAVAFLMGMAYQELRQQDLDKEDENFPLIIAVRAIRK